MMLSIDFGDALLECFVKAGIKPYVGEFSIVNCKKTFLLTGNWRLLKT
jgi:hypothetical protein